jgi:hypothetical protein
VTALEAVEEEVESFEDPGRELQESRLSDTGLNEAGASMTGSPAQQNTSTLAREHQIHHEPLIPAAILEDPHETGQMEVIDFTFWSFERGQFRVADLFQVRLSDTSPVERSAKKYMRKGFSLYDHLQHSVSPATCFRAGPADGTNAIYMFSTEEEKKLVDKGQLVGAKALMPRFPDKPERPLKRRQFEQLEEIEEEL